MQSLLQVREHKFRKFLIENQCNCMMWTCLRPSHRNKKTCIFVHSPRTTTTADPLGQRMSEGAFSMCTRTGKREARRTQFSVRCTSGSPCERRPAKKNGCRVHCASWPVAMTKPDALFHLDGRNFRNRVFQRHVPRQRCLRYGAEALAVQRGWAVLFKRGQMLRRAVSLV